MNHAECVELALTDMAQFTEVTGYVFVANEIVCHIAAGIGLGDLMIFYEGGHECVSYPVSLGIDDEIRSALAAGNTVEFSGWEVETGDGYAVIVDAIKSVSPRGEERGMLFQSWEMN